MGRVRGGGAQESRCLRAHAPRLTIDARHVPSPHKESQPDPSLLSCRFSQAFHDETKARRGSTDTSNMQNYMDLTEEDWSLFLSGAKQRK
eukprot:6191558-Pleurochrysis_carterae.AAC.2